ncbi:MAG: metallopeptidase TldD-related protein [Myxococcota bacterium]
MRAKEETFRILEAALSVASSGVDEAEIAIAGGDLETTHFADNRVLPSVERGMEVMSIRVGVEGRMVRTLTSDLSSSGIKSAVQLLKSQVEHLPASAKGFGLPGPQTYQETYAYDPESDALRWLDRERLAGQAVLLALRHRLSASGRITVQRGAFDACGHPTAYAVANTRGLVAYHPQTKVSLHYEMRGPEGGAGWAEDTSFILADLKPDELLASAMSRASDRSTRRSVAAGHFPVVLEPAVVGQLLAHLGRHVGAASVAAGASFLAGASGRKVAADDILLYDDHTHLLHRGSPFDDEGVARTRVTLIDHGNTGEPVYSWSSAQRYSGQPTGHRVFDAVGVEAEWAQHLVLEGDSRTASDLLGEMNHGLLVTRLGSTATVDARQLTVMGSTSHGLHLVEGGEVVAPLEDMQFTVSVLDILQEAAGRSESVWAAGSVVPALLTRMPLTPF